MTDPAPQPAATPPAGSAPLDDVSAEPATSVVVDRAAGDGPRPVMVCFGGLSNGTDAAPYEFVRQTGELGVHRVFVRDLGQCWYQRGLPGTAEGVDGAALYLAGVVDASGPVADGSPWATRPGPSPPCCSACCAVPTRRSPSAPRPRSPGSAACAAADRRWRAQISDARRHAAERDHLDLVRLLRTRPHPGRVTVHHGERDAMDTRSAHRLGTVHGVTVAAHPGGHLFIRRLRDAGTLLPLLDRAVHP